MMETVSSEAVLARIYGVFKLLGFDRCAYLAPRDQAVLAVVEKYAKFRQGDTWRTIQAAFDASGMRPTAPDRWGRGVPVTAEQKGTGTGGM